MIKGKTEPRLWTPPLRKLTQETSLGFAFCSFCDALGVTLLPWQKWLAVHALEIVHEGGHVAVPFPLRHCFDQQTKWKNIF